MYHIAEIYRDVQRDVETRYGGSALAAYTPFPYLYSLSIKAASTLQRKGPELIRSSAVYSRDKIVDGVNSTKQTASYCTQLVASSVNECYYITKKKTETVDLPPILAPAREHVLTLFNRVENAAKFVQSDDMKELYVVAKARVRDNTMARHLVLPCVTAIEVFPSREEVENRADSFIDVSRTSFQQIIDHVYSATEIIEQHLTMVQWNILGRGPYASLQRDRKLDIIHAIEQRRLYTESPFRKYELMSSIKAVNEMLYRDINEKFPHSGGTPLTEKDIEKLPELKRSLESLVPDTFPCWVHYVGTVVDDTVNPELRSCTEIEIEKQSNQKAAACSVKTDVKWTRFAQHEARRLERAYHRYKRCAEDRMVLVDEGRFEVDLKTMIKSPVYWPMIEVEYVQRATWLYAERNYELVPYSEEASKVLEDAFVYYLRHVENERALMTKNTTTPSRNHAGNAAQNKRVTLTIPIDGHLVEICSSTEMYQYRKFLAGTTPFTSKRRVFRGDPRIGGSSSGVCLTEGGSDPLSVKLWRDAVQGFPLCESSRSTENADLEGEIDHLVFIVHGIGEALHTIDLNVVQLRSIIECAMNLRKLHSKSLKSSHFKDCAWVQDKKVEFLPVEWHTKLHNSEISNDEVIRDVTLPSIPKLRAFANDTILDVLYYMSPNYHEAILHAVAEEMNRIHSLFLKRNGQRFSGKVSIIGHSLGSIITFDLLSNQTTEWDISETSSVNAKSSRINKIPRRKFSYPPRRRNLRSNQVEGSDTCCRNNISDHQEVHGPVPVKCHTNQEHIEQSARCALNRLSIGPYNDFSYCKTAYPVLDFPVENMFMLGSPMGMFLPIRQQVLTREYQLPTCARMFNIYHPYDPVAYRIEPLIARNESGAELKPQIIPTFDGSGYRYQYQLKRKVRKLWYELRNWKLSFETKADRFAHMLGVLDEIPPSIRSSGFSPRSLKIHSKAHRSSVSSITPLLYSNEGRTVVNRSVGFDDEDDKFSRYGRLCEGNPIDYALQETAYEVTNEYLFALTAHVFYWNSIDASLFIANQLFRDVKQVRCVSSSSDPVLGSPKGRKEQDNSSSDTVPSQDSDTLGGLIERIARLEAHDERISARLAAVRTQMDKLQPHAPYRIE